MGYYDDNKDLRFYVEKGIDWEPIVLANEYGLAEPEKTEDAVATFRDVLSMVGEFVEAEIAPHAAQIDREGVEFADGEARFPERLQSIFDEIRKLDLHRLPLPRDFDGSNMPTLVYFLNSELFARADVSVMAHHGFHAGIAMALLWFSVLEGTTQVDREGKKIVSTRFRKAMDEIANGEAWGSMDITEPDAGSDMAQLRAIGEQDEEGNWTVSGQKIFITSGHGKYHFVIARTEKAGSDEDPSAGLDGLSFFLVPIFEDDDEGQRTWFATLDRVEEKLGHHGSATVALTFDRTPAMLIGERGDGFKHMLTLMNNARLGVGFESIGLCEASLRLARAYAAERPSMGKTIDRHEMIADYLDEMESDIEGLRALAVYGAVSEELAQKNQVRLMLNPPVDELERRRIEQMVSRHKRRARRVMPLLKYLAAEKAVEMARACVQIHGGNGYMQEYGAEKLLRDALVMPIYEGTSQIQSLMAMKDTLGGIMKNPQAFVRRLAQATWRSLSASDSLERRVAKVQSISLNAQQYLMRKTATDKLQSLGERPIGEWPTAFLKNWNPKRDFSFAMLHAERLTRILVDEAILGALLEQARRHPERRAVLERYLERAEPRVRFLSDQITTLGQRLLDNLSAGAKADESAA